MASVLLASRLGKSGLFALSVCFIVSSNVTVQLTVPLFGVPFSLAVVIYSCVYLIADLVSEHWGKKAGYQLAGTNLLAQLFLWAYVWLSLRSLPETGQSSPQIVESARQLFATTGQITVAAIVASLGPFVDVFVFSKIREAMRRSAGDEGESRSVLRLIVRNKVSTLVAHIVNTTLFFSIALWGMEAKTVVGIVFTATLAKIFVMTIDTPFLVLASRLISSNKSEQ